MPAVALADTLPLTRRTLRYSRPMRFFAVMVVSCLALAVGAGARAAAPSELVFDTVQGSQKATKAGYTLSERLNSGTGQRIGTAAVVCTYTPPKAQLHSGASCRIRFVFTDGTISTRATIVFRDNSGKLRVTGGTGKYKGTGGQGTLSEVRPGLSEVDLKLSS
jgi:hypothetical protein